MNVYLQLQCEVSGTGHDNVWLHPSLTIALLAVHVPAVNLQSRRKNGIPVLLGTVSRFRSQEHQPTWERRQEP